MKDKYSQGGLINNQNQLEKPEIIAPGKILVSEPMYKKYGPNLLRKLNESPNAEIIILKNEIQK